MKTRPWFQIHLSTAIVLMLVAGALVWRNVAPRHVAWYDPITVSGPCFGFSSEQKSNQEIFHQAMLDGHYWITGWPMVISMQTVNQPMETMTIVPAIPANVLSGVLILVCVAVPLEWRIRRANISERIARKST